MSNPNDDQTEAVVAQFEGQWREGNRPWIFEFLAQVDVEERDSVLSDLIAVDIKFRKQNGEKSRPGDYMQLGPHAVGIAFQQLHESFSSLDAVRDYNVTAFDTHEDEQTDDATIAPKGQNAIGLESGATNGFIGPYELLEKIGEGGMGTVWMAQQHQPVRRRVALKVIRDEIGSEAAIARFEAERQAIALMEHQNIAKILDAGTTKSGNPYFAMELVEGVPLNEYCNRNKLGIRERLELMIPVCRAIHHAHQKGIIHRDLKHSNVLVTQYDGHPVPKVIDFGLAKAFEHQNKLTEETIFTEYGRVVGTLQYMSPEQAELNSVDVDTRSDIYSLGVMVYKLLTGTTPLNTDSAEPKSLVQVLDLIREQEPQKPSDRLVSFTSKRLEKVAKNQDVKPEKLIRLVKTDVDWIVMKAIEKDRERRYQSANGLALDIDRFLNDEEVRACPPTTRYRVEKFYKRNKRLVAALAVISAVLVLGVIGTGAGFFWALNERGIANLKTQEATVEAENALIAEKQAHKAQSIAETRYRAILIKSAYSDWQLGNVESAWQMLNSLDASDVGWESRFLKTEFSSSENVLYGHALDVTSLDASPNGKLIVSTSRDQTVKVWDAGTKKLLHTTNLPAMPYQVCFSPDSKTIACVDRQNNIMLLDAGGGGIRKTLAAQDSDITCVDFSNDGQQLVIGTGDIDYEGVGRFEVKKGKTKPMVRVLSIEDGAVIAELDGHAKSITAVDFSSDGQYIVSGSRDSTIRTWKKDGETFVASQSMISHFPEVLDVRISPNHKIFASCGKDSTIRLWDLETGDSIRTLVGHQKDVIEINFNSDGTNIVSGSADGTARIWNLRGEEQLVYQGHFSQINDVCFSSDDSEIFTASSDKTVRAWNARTKPSTLAVRVHQDVVWQTAFTRDSKKLISVGEDGAVCIIDPQNGKLLSKNEDQEMAALCVAHSPVSEFFVTGGADSVLRIFNSTDGSLIKAINAHGEDYIWDVSFSPDGTKLLTASSDNTFKVWNTETWKMIEQVQAHNGELGSARYSPDGRYILSASDDMFVRLWDASTYDLDIEFSGHRNAVWRAIFSPNGEIIASSSYDGKINIWDRTEGTLLRSIDAHQTQIAGLVFSADGSRIISASDDQSIRIWDVETGVELFVLRDHGENAVVAATFSHDGTKLVTGNQGGWVTIRSAASLDWDIQPVLPQETIKLSTDALMAVTNDCETDDDYRKQLEIADRCCRFFPNYHPYTICGIAQYRLHSFNDSIASLREAQRLEPIMYGEPDLPPNIEGYLILNLLKLDDLKQATELKSVFMDKCELKIWNESEQIDNLRAEVEKAFETHALGKSQLGSSE